MRFAAILAILPAVALGVTVETLPRSEYADTEVSTNIPFEVSFDAMSQMSFSISLEASPSNCVEVSIGEDANGDGVLSLDETDQTFGYNCGHWFQRDAVVDEVKVIGEGEQRNVSSSRVTRTFTLKKRKLDELWNLVKVTRRISTGRKAAAKRSLEWCKTEVCELATVEGAKPGAALILK